MSAPARSATSAEAATPLTDIGPALRRLRMRRGLRQYEAAERAGVTKAMLSAYETGKRRPSLKTLDSLLEAMQAHLGDLHRALVEERHRRALDARAAASRGDDDEAAGTTSGDSTRRGDFEVRDGGASWGAGWESPRGGPEVWPSPRPPADLYRLLELDGPLSAEEELALGELLQGFLKLVRYVRRRAALGPGSGAPASPFDEG